TGRSESCWRRAGSFQGPTARCDSRPRAAERTAPAPRKLLGHRGIHPPPQTLSPESLRLRRRHPPRHSDGPILDRTASCTWTFSDDVPAAAHKRNRCPHASRERKPPFPASPLPAHSLHQQIERKEGGEQFPSIS